MVKKAPTNRKLPGEVVLVGVESSGKSLLCRHLERLTAQVGADGAKKKSKKAAVAAAPAPLNTSTQPSIGVELVELAHRECIFDVRECGGTMQPVWPQYLAQAAAVIFVADTSSAEGCGGAVAEVCDVLRQAPERVLLFLNKRDAANAVPLETTRLLFDLDALEAHNAERLTVLSGSALAGDGLEAVLDWCVDSLAERERLEAEVKALLAAKEAKQKANEKTASAANAAAEAAAEAATAGDSAAARPKSKRPWRRLRTSVAAAAAFRDADKFSAPAAADPAS